MNQCKLQCNSRGNRRGVSMVYTSMMLVTLFAFSSLAVDMGRVQVAKTELRRAVDAAARYGATGLDLDAATAISRATVSIADNKVDGGSHTLVTAQDVRLGKWDTATRKFTVLTGSDRDNANAIEVTGRRLKSRGNAIPLTFARLLGIDTCNINNVPATAMVIKSVKVDQYIPATANPFLAGMPKGSSASLNNPHNSPDYAGDGKNPRQSPMQVNMGLFEGMKLNFDSISGDARHDPNLDYFAPDGELADIGNNTNGSENGISDLVAPINALVGVFVSDDQPNKTSAPERLDFSNSTSRDFNTLQPKLKQLFFIGDGLTSKGETQQFVVPKGATRLYLATWDFFEWNNNAGSRNVKVYRPAQVVLVK